MCIVDAESGMVQRELNLEEGAVEHFAWDKSGTQLAICTRNYNPERCVLRTVDAESGAIRHKVEKMPPESFDCVAWNPFGTKFALAGSLHSSSDALRIVDAGSGGIEKQVDIIKYDFFGYKFRVYSIEWTT